MISAYTNSPQSYTLDVGVSKELGTFVIEVHNFILAGFMVLEIIKYYLICLLIGILLI